VTIGAVAIDCGWLCQLDELDYDDIQVALTFLGALDRHEIPIMLDTGGHIMAEYSRNLASRHLGRVYMGRQVKNGRFVMYDGSPEKACAEALDRMGFDPSDIPYVAVAQRGGGAYLTHENKHLGAGRIELVRKHCGVQIADLAAAAALLT